jgi:hypothetical protein
MAFNSAGDLFVANNNGTSIEEYSPAGADLGAFATGLNSPIGLVFNSAGDLLTTNFVPGSGQIIEITPGGSQSLFASTGLDDPFGLAIDSSGNVYAANFLGGNIEEFSASGLDEGAFVSGISLPTGLAFAQSPAAPGTPEPGSVSVLMGVFFAGLVNIARRRRTSNRPGRPAR